MGYIMRLIRGIGFVLFLMFFVVVISSCGDREKVMSSGEPSLESLYQSWYTLANLKPENIDYLTALQLSQEMVKRYGEEGINKLFKVLEVPDEPATVKMLAVMSLTAFVKPDWKDRLMELCKPGVEVNSRVCALTLLNLIPGEDITGYLKSLLNDPEPRVQFVVLTSLAKRNQPEGVEKLNELWDKASRPQDREHILLSIPPQRTREFLDLYRAGVTDMEISKSVRREAIITLGRFGDKSDERVLKEVMEKDTDVDMKELAQGAIDAIYSRLEHRENTSEKINTSELNSEVRSVNDSFEGNLR